MTESASTRYALQPCRDFLACVQSDTADLSRVANWLRFDAAGTVKVTAEGGATGSCTVIAGECWRGMRIRQVWDTGTSLTDAQILLGVL